MQISNAHGSRRRSGLFRRTAALALMFPLWLNGVRMVCAVPSASAEAMPMAADAAVPDHCAKICSLETHGSDDTAVASVSSTDDGEICLLMATTSNGSVEAFAFAVAPPVPVIGFTVTRTTGEIIPEPTVRYPNPAPTTLTPPPRA
jgi:hypothetical protein